MSVVRAACLPVPAALVSRDWGGVAFSLNLWAASREVSRSSYAVPAPNLRVPRFALPKRSSFAKEAEFD